MNTRLQVEHPVTELVSGIDLVREQIRVASGEVLSFTQDDIDLRGWSIEVRVNAENPAGGKFLPAPGKIDKLVAPQGFGTRWDGGYESGDEVSQFYDNLVGKLIVWGPTARRPSGAVAGHQRAFVIDGIDTTLPAQLLILDEPDFVAGEHSTNWIDSGASIFRGHGPAARHPRTRATTPSPGPPRRRRRGQAASASPWPWVPESAMVAGPRRSRRAAANPARACRCAGGAAGTGAIAAPCRAPSSRSTSPSATRSRPPGRRVLEAMKMRTTSPPTWPAPSPRSRSKPAAVGSGDIVVVVTPARRRVVRRHLDR